MNGNISMKLVVFNHNQVYVTLVTLRRSLGQRSRSSSAWLPQKPCECDGSWTTEEIWTKT